MALDLDTTAATLREAQQKGVGVSFFGLGLTAANPIQIQQALDICEEEIRKVTGKLNGRSSPEEMARSRTELCAGIPAGERYGWHSFRRAFANALRNVPLRDLKDLGGWKTEQTVVAVYLKVDEQSQRTALAKLG